MHILQFAKFSQFLFIIYFVIWFTPDAVLALFSAWEICGSRNLSQALEHAGGNCWKWDVNLGLLASNPMI